LRKIVFLDRDGTINEDAGYLVDPQNVSLIRGAARALAQLRGAGYELVVVSNQSAVARGLGSLDDVVAVNSAVQAALIREDTAAVIAEFLFCPHGPEDSCSCRKPQTGLLREFAKRCQFDPVECYLIGDKRSDIEFGWNAGLPRKNCLLVLTGEGNGEAEQVPLETPRFDTIESAAEFIISHIA
jgi:D-glycero-D-manno-heptose 1,7-bisphosphate phosphatase